MKRLTILFCTFLICIFSVSVFANDNKVVDDYGVFSSSEIEELETKVKDEIDEVNFDIVVYFANEDGDITSIADDYFDYNDYGFDYDDNGIILCVNYYDRDYTITTKGIDTITLFTDQALNDIYSVVTPYLKDGDNYNAVVAFVEGIDYVYKNQDSYSYHYYSPEESEDYNYEHYTKSSETRIKEACLVGGGVSVCVSLVVFLILRGQLKTQGIKHEAYQYMSDSNLNIFRSGEIFLYKTQTRTRIPRNDGPSNGGGSHTHYSSSGAIHGGGGSHRF